MVTGGSGAVTLRTTGERRPSLRHMRLRLDDPGLVPDLLTYLDNRVDLVTERLGDHEVEVGVLGSFADGGRMELERYLGPWLQAHQAAVLEFVAEEPTVVLPSVDELADELLQQLEQAETVGEGPSLDAA